NNSSQGSFLLRAFATRSQQISWDHLCEFSDISRCHTQYRSRLAGVAASAMKRASPEPLQQRDLGIGPQRNLRIRQHEVLFVVERVYPSPRVERLLAQLGQRPRTERRFHVADQL